MDETMRAKEKEILNVVRETGGVVTSAAQMVPMGHNQAQYVYLPPDGGDWVFEGISPDKSVALWRAVRTPTKENEQ